MIVPYLILIQMLLFTALRVLFLLWNWQSFHTQPGADLFFAFIHGFRFDMAAISILAVVPFIVEVLSLPWLERTWRGWAVTGSFILLQFPGSLFSMVDSEFVNFTGRRMTFDSLFYYGEASGKLSQILGSYLGLASTSAVLYLIYLYIVFKCRRRGFALAGSVAKKALISFGLFLVLIVAARGGFQKKPLGFAHAQIFVGSMMNNLVMNSAFTVLQTVKRESLPRIQYFENRENMLAALPGSWKKASAMEGHRFSKPQNIVLIILESFNFDYMGKPFGDAGYTPFLDSLAGRGIFMQNHFANARRSIEGIGAILGGIPAWMNEPFLSSQYMSNYFLGIGSLLAKRNYHTSFFHGGQNGTMYFDSFIKSVGIENYYGANEYPNKMDFDGTWGIYDGPFLQWMLSKLHTFRQPFFSAVFTLSSHNPFAIPSEMSGRFPTGTLDIHESIGYADQSLKEFFEKAASEPWYGDTLFILTADHTYKNSRLEYDNETGQHRIPLILFHSQWEKQPELKPTVDEHQVTSQIDVLPTILDFLGADVPQRNYLARSIFVSGDRPAVTYVDGKYTLFKKEYFLTLSRDGQFRLYRRIDTAEKNPLLESPAIQEALTQELQASIQYFSEGLWDNKLYYPAGGQ